MHEGFVENEEELFSDEYTSSNNIIELDDEDFTSGTYRIQKSETYKIMEDISLNFNAGSQAEGGRMSHKSNEYPGDSYILGFLAGSTVACDDVTIDLNSHAIEMSDEFYYQQRWFTIIELENQQFLPGPAFFGLTLHHGIHGNYNKILNF